jgi:hypothetical protein
MQNFRISIGIICGLLTLCSWPRAIAAQDSAQPAASSMAEAIKEMREQIDNQQQQLAEQQKQIEELRVMLKEQAKSSGDNRTPHPISAAGSRISGEVASTVPLIPSGSAALPAPVLLPAQKNDEDQPLQFRLASAYFTPFGFMDLTSVFRDTDAGTNIGTNFGGIPYRTPSNVAGNLSEFRLSPQNSRLGFRIDAKVKGASVLGY